MKLHKLLPAILMAILLMLTACAGDSAPEQTTAAAETDPAPEKISYGPLSPGDEAPDFTLTLLDGSEFTLSDHRDNVVVINFWATWCPPCVSEMPELQQLAENYADQGVYVLAVNCSETEQKTLDFIEGRKLALNVGLDPEMDVQNKYPTNGIPYTVFVGPDGKGAYTQTGIHPDDNYGHLSGILDKILLQ